MSKEAGMAMGGADPFGTGLGSALQLGQATSSGSPLMTQMPPPMMDMQLIRSAITEAQAAGQDPLGMIAQRMASQASPPQPGSLQALMKNPEVMKMLMGAVKAPEQERTQRLSPPQPGFAPQLGAGANPQALIGNLYNQNAARRGAPPPSLGQLLKGG